MIQPNIQSLLVPSSPYQFTPRSGDVVDGDTLRIEGGNNGRLSGFDAFESDQLGYLPDGSTVPLGRNATEQLDGLITPATDVRGIGGQTYRRPVVVARNRGSDVAFPMLRSGEALAAPEYLKDDPERLAAYMEAERQARLNRQGGHGVEVMSPDAYRSAKRWGLKLRPDESAEFNSDLPDFRPEFQRLSPEEEQDYFAMLAKHSGDPNFGQDTLDSYWRSKGKVASRQQIPCLYLHLHKAV